MLQNLALGFLILLYRQRHTASAVYLVLYVVGLVLLLSPAMPIAVHVTLQLLAVPLTASSKVCHLEGNG